MYKLMILLEKLTFKTANYSIATNNSYREIAIKRGKMKKIYMVLLIVSVFFGLFIHSDSNRNKKMTDIKDLAKFYWELYSHLCEFGFEDEQAMKIILKEAKIPRQKTAKKEKDLKKEIEDVIRERGTGKFNTNGVR